ncbi:integrase arm-type DNA-binding domain-containing protein [Desulfobotulus sp. H1]|uniref:Integrase arm-type DNA-binding domain-containing protein n=1 Tax=Desulfobotulus pelophilus TaxID=2823377 RepID=A0ABT3NCT5_9BACT|nr:integrase arm-type DNA-binding domain-containing protein [Desulfobotulus pelophilus]MCW7755286.1 integrase arm-type DNA-binding domain-containing protein [Desulfobotulus pelophilus]
MALGKLNNMVCEKAEVREKRYFLTDGDGLSLQIEPTGRKIWKLRYYIDGKQKMASLGTFPVVSLKEARIAAAKARVDLADGLAPGGKGKRKGADQAFQALALDWHEKIHAMQVVPSHADRNLSRIKNLILPHLGEHHPDDITPPMVLDMLLKICDSGRIETAHRVKSIISLIFRYGISTGRAQRDPTQDLAGLIPSYKTEHFPAILDKAELGGLLRALDQYGGSVIVRSAARFLPLVFCRPGEMLSMRWQDINPEEALWYRTTTKTQTEMISPLSRQAMQILAEVHSLTADGEFVFPALRGKGRMLSNTSIKAVLDSLGYAGKMTAHGWRAVARTHLVETLNFPESVVEMQLGHRVKDALGRAYNRTTFLEQRTGMVQQWADWLDELRAMPAPSSPASAPGEQNAWNQWRA